MTTEDFYAHFNDVPSISQRIDLLWELLVNNDQRLTRRLVYLIKHPLLVENPQRFGAVLRELKQEALLEPLLDTVLEASSNDAAWITEYLLTAQILLRTLDNGLQLSLEQTKRLLDWTLAQPVESQNSSYAFAILFLAAKNEVFKQTITQLIQDQTLSAQVRTIFLEGLIGQYGQECKTLLQQILQTETDPSFKHFLGEMIEGLNNFQEKESNS